jgi:hypothetical protein
MLTSHFGARAVLFKGRQTVRHWPADCPRAPCSSRVRPVLASSHVDLSRCQSFVASSLADRPPRGLGPFAWHKLLSDRPRVGYGPSVFRGVVLVVRGSFSDRPPTPSGPFARTSRTVRPRLRRVAKSFAP